MNEKHNKMSAGFVVTSLVIATMALGVFTALTFGVLKKSSGSIVEDMAKSADFKDASRFAILPAQLLREAGSSSLSERMGNVGSQKVICALDQDLYGKLAATDNVTSEAIDIDGRHISYITVPENMDSDVVSLIFKAKLPNEKVKCRNVKGGSFFFFDVTPSISYQNELGLS